MYSEWIPCVFFLTARTQQLCDRGVRVERFDFFNQSKTMCCCRNGIPNACFDLYKPCVLCVSFLTANATQPLHQSDYAREIGMMIVITCCEL